MKIEPGKFYKTRSGRKARIYAVDGDSVRPIHGAIIANGDWILAGWGMDGNFYDSSNESEYDLISEWTEPLDFDWSVLPPWMNWIAKDSDDNWWAFSHKPFLTKSIWETNGDGLSIPPNYAPKNFTGDWTKSLHERPQP